MKYILIHGLGQSEKAWEEVDSLLGGSNELIDLNLLLYEKEKIYENLYMEFEKYCNKFSGKINLCGLSLGGVLALDYTIKNPEKVESLILIGTQYKFSKGLMKFQNIIFKFLPDKIFKELGFTRKDFLSLTNSVIDINFFNRLEEISNKTIIICGKKDRANIKASINMHKKIPNSKLYIIDGAGHEVNRDRPRELAEIIKLNI